MYTDENSEYLDIDEILSSTFDETLECMKKAVNYTSIISVGLLTAEIVTIFLPIPTILKVIGIGLMFIKRIDISIGIRKLESIL